MNKRNIEAINPLSPAQQGMLYESIRAPESGIHIEQSVYSLTGSIDLAAFRRAWQWSVDRHTILRTGFVWKEQAEPLQVTLRQVEIALDYRDWRSMVSAEQKEHLEKYLQDDRRRGFQLAHAPLMRLTLFHLSEDTYCFVWTSHHVLMDGWSHQILLNEVIACYAALSRGQTFALPPSPSYGEYIAWLNKQDVSEAEAFWRQRLEGFHMTTPLGREVESMPPEEIEERVEPLQFYLSQTMTSALQTVIRSHHLTLSTLLQGLWALMLGRYSQSDDVVFGITVSGRSKDLVGIESMVGLCINTLPLRVRLPAQASFWPWLADLQRANIEMHRYEHCSAAQIQSWSGLPGTARLYESLLVVENYPARVTSAAFEVDIAVDNVQLIGAQTKYAFTLLIITGAELCVRCIYDTRVLTRSNASLIMKHLHLLLEFITSNPQVNLEELAGLIPTEQIPRVRAISATGEETPIRSGHANPVEELVATIWCDVLGVRQVALESNFFLLGGHSLIATQMTSRLRAVLGVEIPLRAVFETPTVAGLARHIEQHLRKREGMELPPLVATERPSEIPLGFAEQRLWFLERLNPGSTVYLEHTAYRIRGEVENRLLERSLEDLIHRHENLRTTFAEREGQPRRIIHPLQPFTLPVIDLQALNLEKRAEEVEQLSRQEAQRPADLQKGPLLRLYLLRFKDQEHILFLTLHHILTDRWSTEILLRELIALYRAYRAGQPSPLPPLPIQYADYALWQRQWLQGETLQREIAYWKKQLWRSVPLQLPTDFPRTTTQDNAGASYTSTFTSELSQDLVRLSQQEGVSLFILLLTIFQVLLYRLSGQTDIVLGTDIANRTHLEIEGLIGFFVNLLALRTRLQAAVSFRKLLQQVRTMVLNAYTHQHLPFELVIEHVQGERREYQAPLVQALFVMQNTPPLQEDLEGMTFERIQREDISARFDLAIFMYEGEQGLHASVVYRTALFKEQTIATLLRSFAVLASHVVVRPETSIDELEIYSADEQIARAEYEKELYRIGSRSWQNRTARTIDLSAIDFNTTQEGL